MAWNEPGSGKQRDPWKDSGGGPSPDFEATLKRIGAWFSRLSRSGRWELAPQSKITSVCGTVDLDLGQTTLHGAETVVHVKNVFGTITLRVPRGVQVSVDGGGPFGTRDIDLPDTGPVGDAPKLRIVTSGVGGTLRIRTSRERLGPGQQ